MKLPLFIWTWVSIANWLLNNLESYYKCDTNGSFPDAHWSNTGTINWATYTASWKINWWYSFDWVNDYIGIPHISAYNSDNNTYSFWVKSPSTTNPSSSKWLFWKAPTTWFDREIGINFSATTWYIQVSIWNWTDTIFTITWTNDFYDANYHLVVVKKIYWVSWDTLELYVDDVLEASWTATFNWVQNSNEIVLWKLSSISDPARYFGWDMDEVWIWSDELTTAQGTDLDNSWAWLSYDNFTS